MSEDSINTTIADHYKAVLFDIEKSNDHVIVYNEVRYIVQNNPKINIQNSFYAFITSCYATNLFMCIRRHINEKYKKQSYSLINLLVELEKYFGEKGDEYNLEKVIKDICIIKEYANKYKFITDKVISHLDKDIIGKSVEYNMEELEECFDGLRECIMNYHDIFCSGKIYLGLVRQDEETWKDIFKTPWIEEK